MVESMALFMAHVQAPVIAVADPLRQAPLVGVRRAASWFIQQWRFSCLPAARSERVFVLVLAIALMCLGDLAMTLDHARTIGLFEANPLARELMRQHSPEFLLAFKGGSIFIGCSLLLYLRKARIAELGAWAALFAMTLLCLHWNGYSQGLSEITPQYAAMASGSFPCDTWVYWGP